jgi:glutamyl-tRNA reductase
MVYPTMHSSVNNIDVVNVRLTHKTADVPLLEAVAFKDKRIALSEIRALNDIKECVVLQTCNRIEIYAVNTDAEKIAHALKDYLVRRSGEKADEARTAIELSINDNALRHILRIASGLESMVMGEDQVLNQLWTAFLEAEEEKTVGPVLRHIFNKASIVGLQVWHQYRRRVHRFCCR